jgi:hypothetical protein
MLDVSNRIRPFFVADNWASGSGSVIGGWKLSLNGAEISVESVTLRNIFKRYGVCDFVKLDVEGSEQRILRANVSAFKSVKWLIVEYHPVENTSLKQCLTYMKRAGFKNFEVEEDNDSMGKLGNKHLSLIYAWR